MKPLVVEIHELGRELALLIGPGSSVERSRRSEVRVLLREAFLATQDASDEAELSALQDRLAEALKSIKGSDDRPGQVESSAKEEVLPPREERNDAAKKAHSSVESDADPNEDNDRAVENLPPEPPADLADRLIRHRRFGSLDHAVGHRNAGFRPAGQSAADGLADGIEKRAERVLSHVSDTEGKAAGGAEPRPIRTEEENKELILSKMR